MSLKTVPSDWHRDVVAVLRTDDSRAIRYTDDAWKRFEATFPDAFRSDLHAAFRTALRDDTLVGCPVEMKTPPGETWEFYFSFRGRRLYGKILLRPDRSGVVIFSAHPPLKDKLICE
ncbi:MAG: hypothetical protein WC205_01415 [Opitutaceae bacterium]|jgi:hypothetical protein